MRILHVATFAHPDRFGGAERVIHGIAKAQAAAGDDVTVLVANLDGLPEHAEIDGIRWIRFALRAGSPGAGFLFAAGAGCRAALSTLATTGPYDVLHAHQLATATVALRMRGIAKRRVFSFYAPYADERAAQNPAGGGALEHIRHRLAQFVARRLDRACLERADRVVALSRFSAGQIAAIAPGAVARTSIVPPGADVERFAPIDAAERRSIRAELSIPDGAPLLLSVRRLVKRMGLDLLLDAAAALHRDGARFVLLVGGDGPEREALERRAAPLRDFVRFLGSIDEERLPRLFAAADLFVLPTRALEGFGMVTLEALACGTPVLGTTVGATPEVLSELLPELPPVTPAADALATGISSALANLPMIAPAAAAAAARIAEHHTWERCAQRLAAVYAGS